MPTNPSEKDKKKQPDSNSVLKYSGMATQMLGITLLLTWGGYKLDKYLAIKFPAFTLAGVLIGFAVGFYLSVKDFLGPKKKKD